MQGISRWDSLQANLLSWIVSHFWLLFFPISLDTHTHTPLLLLEWDSLWNIRSDWGPLKSAVGPWDRLPLISGSSDLPRRLPNITVCACECMCVWVCAHAHLRERERHNMCVPHDLWSCQHSSPHALPWCMEATGEMNHLLWPLVKARSTWTSLCAPTHTHGSHES